MTRPPQPPEPVAPVDWFRRCPNGGTTYRTPRPSTEDSVTNFPEPNTPLCLVSAARDELDPHLTHLDDPDDKDRVARKVVGRVLRELSGSTLEEFGGTESEYLDATRLDEMADEIEDGVA